jgi:hypothetical protein
MNSKDAKKILKLVKNTDPMLRRKIYDQLLRYQGLDDIIEDIYDEWSEESKKQKTLD